MKTLAPAMTPQLQLIDINGQPVQIGNGRIVCRKVYGIEAGKLSFIAIDPAPALLRCLERTLQHIAG